jgi:hypothetical protein
MRTYFVLLALLGLWICSILVMDGMEEDYRRDRAERRPRSLRH